MTLSSVKAVLGQQHSSSASMSLLRAAAARLNLYHEMDPIVFPLPGCSRQYGSQGIQHNEKKLIVGPTQEQMYEIITNVREYQEFVPYIQKSTILLPSNVVGKDPKVEYMEAEVEVGFQVFLERYTSKIHMEFPTKVMTRTEDSNLFSHLHSCWKLHPGPTPTSVWVDFEVDFAFKSALYSQVATIFLEEVVKKMMGAFEKRCRDVYGLS